MSSRAAAEAGVVLDERVHGEAHQLLGLVAHLRDEAAEAWIEVVAVQAARRLADVGAEVGRSLHLADHLHDGDDRPEIARHRLLKRQHGVAAVLELGTALIEAVVGLDQPLGSVEIAVEQDLGRSRDHLDEHRRDARHLLAELGELLVEALPGFDHPNLPVT